MRRARLVVLLLALLALATPTAALDPARVLTQYQNDRWQTEQGLPQSTVQAITETRDGYLWVGTLEGLARFDGIRFTVYDARTNPELGSGSVLGLMQDTDGNLWIARTGAAVLYKDGHFRIAFGDDVTAGATVWSFAQANDGAVWAATNNGLVRWADGKTRVFHKADGLPTERLRSVAFGRDGTLWIGTTGGGLVSYADGLFHALDPGDGFPHAEVRAVVADPAGGVWAATAGGGLARVAGGLVKVYTVADGLPSNQLSALAVDARGTLWIGTWGAGVCRLAAGRFSSLSSAGGLSGDQIWSLLSDREGSLWIGTWVGGLNRLRDRRFEVFGQPEGLSHDNTRAVLHARDGSIWVATAGGGVNRIVGSTVTAFRTKDGLPSDETSSLCEDRDGSIWIGTNTAGIARFSHGRITSFGPAQGLPGVDVRAILQDRNGTLWAGTMAGLARLEGGRFVPVKAPGLTVENLVALFEDRSGTLWLGTAGQGAIRYRNGEFRVLTVGDGLVSNKVMAFYEDARGSLWIGSGGGGLTRLRDNRLVAIRPKDGLWDGFAQTILEDRAGHLWMTCNRGFFSVPLTELDAFADGRLARVTSVGYGSSDTLRSTTFAGGQSPAGTVDERGRLWFPSFKGLVIVDPVNIPNYSRDLTVRLEEVKVNGVLQAPAATLVVSPGAAALSIRYTVVTLVDADRIRFRCWMEGTPGDWADAGTKHEALYPGLRPGHLTFHVVASADGETWSQPAALLRITIQPYFYQTVSFWLLVAVLAGGIVITGVRVRILQHRRREADLQQRVNKALGEIHTLHGLLPICAWCKKVRNDGGYWEQIEVYVRDHSAATFSHGICPDCEARVASAGHARAPEP